MSNPLNKHKAGRPGDGSAQASRHGGIRGHLPKSLYASRHFLVLKKIGYKHMIKTSIYPVNMHFVPPNLKIGYRPGSAKTVFVSKIFCFEGHSASRCSITSKLKVPGKHFGERFGLLLHWLYTR